MSVYSSSGDPDRSQQIENWVRGAINWTSSTQVSCRSSFSGMAKSTDASSTKSSSLSRRATSLKKTVQKGAKAIARPFKKLKTTISNASTSQPPSCSQSTTTLPVSDIGARSSRSSTDREEPPAEFGPEEQLGK